MSLSGDDLHAKLADVLDAISKDMPQFVGLFEDESDDPYGVSMTKLATLMLALHVVKDAEYGRSWAKHGVAGVFYNMVRKKDRLGKLIDKLFVAVMSDRDIVEDSGLCVSLFATLVDDAIYGMMAVCYLAKHKPVEFEAWLRSDWCATTGVGLADVLELLHDE